MDLLEKKKKTYIKLFEKKAKNKTIKNLMTIPGISTVRGIIIASIVCQPDRFPNKHHFWGYCMLTRYLDTSDGKIYAKRRIYGRKELKSAFIGAAETTLRTTSSLRRHYDSLRKEGLRHLDARRSLARKIASIALSCLKHNTKYNDDKHEEGPSNKK